MQVSGKVYKDVFVSLVTLLCQTSSERLPHVLKEEVLRFAVNSNLSPYVSQIEWKLQQEKLMCYLRPSIEVVGKVSLLLPYHIFFGGATKIPPKKILSGRCTPIPHFPCKC